MRFLMLTLLLTSGCAMQQDLAKSCHGNTICTTFFGRPVEERLEDHDAAIDRNSASIADLYAQVEYLKLRLNALSERLDVQGVNLEYIQADMANTASDLQELQNQDSVVEMIDPCGDVNGEFDELLLRTRSGALVAYFESGSRRFLSSLQPGSYATTDNTGCSFSVNSSLQVCDSLGCR